MGISFKKREWCGDLDENGNEWKGVEGSRKINETKENKARPLCALALIFLSRSLISPHVCRRY